MMERNTLREIFKLSPLMLIAHILERMVSSCGFDNDGTPFYLTNPD